MPVEDLSLPDQRPLDDKTLFRISPFLSDLVGKGTWKDLPQPPADGWPDASDQSFDLSARRFRREPRQRLADPEAALIQLRRLRVRTLLQIAGDDLAGRIKPYQIRARLRSLAETMVQGAWWVAETCLRERYVHPLVLERRNINPPMAIFSLSRLGAGEPWYTTGPAPIFVHSRAAEFAPALTEKDFAQARRSGKEWPPAREYFHRLARRTLSYLSVPDPAGKGFEPMAEDASPEDSTPLLPGSLVVLFSAFEEHFLGRRPVKEKLSLIRLRFLVGQEKLGRAVESAAREALRRTAQELGRRVRAGLKAWYHDRARAENLPLSPGSLLDLERTIRLAQFTYGADDADFLDPSPLRALDRLTEAGVIGAEGRLVLNRSYSYQWFLVNRLSLFGLRSASVWEELRQGRLDGRIGLPGAAERSSRLMKEAREALAELGRKVKAADSV
ncbi:MAG: hypothetical protein AB1641_30720 [Thermodesulfobacteriota bacterium]